MSIPELNILVHDFLELDAEIKQQQLVAEGLKNKIKEELEARNVEELAVGEHIVRYKDVLTSVFDKSKFKAKYEELYAMFLKQIPSKKFSIS